MLLICDITAKNRQFLQPVYVYLAKVLIVDLCSGFKRCCTYGDVVGDVLQQSNFKDCLRSDLKVGCVFETVIEPSFVLL